MSQHTPQTTTRRLVLDYFVAYALWLVLAAVAMWLVFVWHSILVTIGIRWGLNPWQLRAVDTWGMFLLGFAWLAIFIVTEAYFRKGVQQGGLWQRIAKAFSLAALTVLLSLFLDWLL